MKMQSPRDIASITLRRLLDPLARQVKGGSPPRTVATATGPIVTAALRQQHSPLVEDKRHLATFRTSAALGRPSSAISANNLRCGQRITRLIEKAAPRCLGPSMSTLDVKRSKKAGSHEMDTILQIL